MSYILEALKKLEQKREQEESLKGPSFSHEPARKRTGRLIWPYPVAAAVLLNAGVVAWLVSRTEVKAPPPPVPKVARVNESAVPAPNPVLSQQEQPKTPARAAVQEREATPARAAKTAPDERPAPQAQAERRAAAAPAPPTAPQEASREKGQPSPVQPQTRERKAPSPTPQKGPRAVSNEPAFTVRELPPFIRNDLPEFRVSGHAYSPQPQNRVARINDRILQEGEELSAGLRVEEIVPDGVILSYQGYRIRIPVTLNR